MTMQKIFHNPLLSLMVSSYLVALSPSPSQLFNVAHRKAGNTEKAGRGLGTRLAIWGTSGVGLLQLLYIVLQLCNYGKIISL